MRRVIICSPHLPEGAASIVEWADATQVLRTAAELDGTPRPYLDLAGWRRQAANRAVLCYGHEHAWETDAEFIADGIRLGLVRGELIH